MFLDLTMPDVDGYQVLETLRREGRTIPKVIVMSADIQPEARQRIEKLGAVGFLSKPVSPSALEKVLLENGM
jgi:CheY-like chemotaxis protein